MQDKFDRSHPITPGVFGDPDEFRAVNNFNPVLHRNEHTQQAEDNKIASFDSIFPAFIGMLWLLSASLQVWQEHLPNIQDPHHLYSGGHI